MDEELYDDHDNYYEDNYSDDYDNHNPTQDDNLKKFYFTFDINYNWPAWIYNIINIPDFPVISVPVNDYFLNTESGYNALLYLGNNQYGEGMYKYKNFIQDDMKKEYIAHLQSNARHFVSMPVYYKGLFDILN